MDKLDRFDFQMGPAVLGAFLVFLVMKWLRRRSKKEDVLDDDTHWI